MSIQPEKFFRNFRITIGDPSNDGVILTNPLTCIMNINNAAMCLCRTADISIIGLNRSTRDLIFKDKLNVGLHKPIVIEAGYNGQLIHLFSGNILYAYSEREYPTVSTKIYAQDGGNALNNAYSHWTVSKNMTQEDILKKLCGDMAAYPDAQAGEIGDIKEGTTTKTRGVTIDDLSGLVLNRMTGGLFNIEDSRINLLKPNEVVDGVIPLINSDSGLLGTPQRQDTYVDVKMIFEPRLLTSQVVEVQSSIQSNYNGQFKIVGVSHKVTISDAVCGTAETTINLLEPPLLSDGSQNFNIVQNNIVTPYTPDSKAPYSSSIQSVYNYIKKNGHPPNTKITHGITWNQMLTNFRGGNAYHPLNEMPTLQQLTNVQQTATALQSSVDTYFPGHSINITSGWRSQIGLYHTTGQAVDFTLSGVSVSNVQSVFKQNWFGGLGIAPQHIHADTRPSKITFQDGDY